MALNSSSGWRMVSGSGSTTAGVGGVGGRRRSRRRSVRVRAQGRSGGDGEDSHCVLGVSPYASKQEIKAAYRRLALQYHPDVCKQDYCEQRFRQVNDAYQAILKRQEQESVTYSSRMYDRDEWEEFKEWMGYEGGVPYQWWLGTLSRM